MSKNKSLILCHILKRNGKMYKRWVKPETPVLIACRKCGYADVAFAMDQESHICFSCYHEEPR